jgi:hypothetical protein
MTKGRLARYRENPAKMRGFLFACVSVLLAAAFQSGFTTAAVGGAAGCPAGRFVASARLAAMFIAGFIAGFGP